MSAADRMAVRVNGEVRSVPRRVGLAMIAQSRAQHAPRPAESAVQVVTADAPQLAAKLDRFRDDMAKALDVPTEILTPTPGSNPHDVAAAERQAMTDALERHPVAFIGHVDLSDVDVDESAGVPEFVEDLTALRPKGNAGRAAWAEYAGMVGVEVVGTMGRNEIRDAVVAKLESDRMSRPAFEGGRPATPEDEPVTESAVTHADPGERTA